MSCKRSEAFVIGNHILEQHLLDLMEEYYENRSIVIKNWQANSLEINGFACIRSLQTSNQFYPTKRKKNQDTEFPDALSSMPMKTVGLIPACCTKISCRVQIL